MNLRSDLHRWMTQWRLLDGAEKILLLRLVFLLPAIATGLRVLGLNRLRCLLDRYGTPAPHIIQEDERALAAAERLAALTGMAARRGPYKATCLRESLALWWLLRRRSFPAEIAFGVRPSSGSALDAHAWVEVWGHPLDRTRQADRLYARFQSNQTGEPSQP